MSLLPNQGKKYPLSFRSGMAKRPRGNVVDLDGQWYQSVIDAVARLPKADRGSIALGKALQRAVKRRTPFDKNAVRRFLNPDPSGRRTTIELARAFAAMLHLDPPMLSSSIPEEIRWVNVGRELMRRDQTLFRTALERYEEWVRLARSKDEIHPPDTNRS